MKLGTSLLAGVATTIAGTLLVALTGSVPSDHRVRDLVAILAIFAAAVIIMNNQESLALALQSSGRWRLPPELRSTWSYQTVTGSVTITDRIAIRQVGRLVLATGDSVNITGDAGFSHFRYRIRATITPKA